MSLYQKIRPETFAGVRGNEDAVRMLESFVDRPPEDRPHCILFQGPYGCGKTTLARITATVFGCTKDTIEEINGSNRNGVDDVRILEQNAPSMPIFGNCKAVIIDEAHRMTGPAQDAMLKLLEDTPEHLYMFLCTTEPTKLIKTIRSRATNITVKELSDRDMKRLLKSAAADAGIMLPEEVTIQIVQDSLGHPRDALVVLDSIMGLDESEMLEAAKARAESENMTLELCRLIAKGGKWQEVVKVFDGIKEDPERIRYSILGYFRNCLKRSGSTKHAKVVQCFCDSTYTSGDAGLLVQVFAALNVS